MAIKVYYYGHRNHIVFMKNYMFKPLLPIVIMLKTLRTLTGILLFDKVQKRKRIKFLLRGTLDGIQNHLGKANL